PYRAWRYTGRGGIFLLHFPGPSAATEPIPQLPRTVGVTHHRILWSPDFPPPGYPGDDRPASPLTLALSYKKLSHRGHREHREKTEKLFSSLCVLCVLCGSISFAPLHKTRWQITRPSLSLVTSQAFG